MNGNRHHARCDRTETVWCGRFEHHRSMTTAVITGSGSWMGRACLERLRGTVDRLVAVDLGQPEIDGATGVACDAADPAAVAALVRHVASGGPLRPRPRRGHLPDDGRRPPGLGGRPRWHPAAARRLRATRCAGDRGGVLLVLGGLRRGAVHQRGAGGAAPRPARGRLPRPCCRRRDRRSALRLLAGQGRCDPRRRPGVAPLGGEGRACSLAPGLIDTPMGCQELEHQLAVREMLDTIPMGRPEEVPELAAFSSPTPPRSSPASTCSLNGGMSHG